MDDSIVHRADPEAAVSIAKQPLAAKAADALQLVQARLCRQRTGARPPKTPPASLLRTQRNSGARRLPQASRKMRQAPASIARFPRRLPPKSGLCCPQERKDGVSETAAPSKALDAGARDGAYLRIAIRDGPAPNRAFAILDHGCSICARTPAAVRSARRPSISRLPSRCQSTGCRLGRRTSR